MQASVWKRLFSWTVDIDDHGTTGFATSEEEAKNKVYQLVDLYRAINKSVTHYSIEDPSGVTVLSMDLR